MFSSRTTATTRQDAFTGATVVCAGIVGTETTAGITAATIVVAGITGGADTVGAEESHPGLSGIAMRGV